MCLFLFPFRSRVVSFCHLLTRPCSIEILLLTQQHSSLRPTRAPGFTNGAHALVFAVCVCTESLSRMYVTNMTGYQGSLRDVAPPVVPGLQECLNWNDDEEWPHWFEHVYPSHAAKPCLTTSLLRSEDRYDTPLSLFLIASAFTVTTESPF